MDGASHVGATTTRAERRISFSPSNRSRLVVLHVNSCRLSASRKMDASRRPSGIQQLLAAEQEAQQIVSTARAAKSARLRQAKEEAEREIAEYRAQMEADFQKKLAETSGDSGANVKRLEQETNEKIEQLKQQAASISPEVIQMLLRHVTTVKN
ncbi:hypothetical protein ACQ4PT_030524 [Festuca glaucescens]